MIDPQQILIPSASAIAAIFVTWMVVSKLYTKKIEVYDSIKEALSKSKELLGQAEENLKEKKSEVEQSKTSLSEVEKQIEAKNNKLSVIKIRTQKLVELEERTDEIKHLIENGQNDHKIITQEIKALKEKKEQASKKIIEQKGDIDLYSRLSDYVDFGVFEEPEYIHETSDRYAIEIKAVRDEQKALIKDNLAIQFPEDIQIEGISKKAKAVIAGQTKIMLKAFNIECDLLIGKVTPANFPRTLERIDKVAENLEKAAITFSCGISLDYMELKYEECKLVYEYKLKKQEEKEEQQLIKEQIREEQKAIREYKKAVEKAEKEELMYEKLISKAYDSMTKAQDKEKIMLESKIEILKEQLEEAQEKGLRAKSLAEQTRRGHVYIISNIGSFGEGVYKIGLTRRLDPMDRVKELGDASVPFRFDVHAIIYSDDAPSLETELHRKFNKRRVNVVNRRKEFFRVDLDEIREAVEEICDDDINFRMTKSAEEYYESLRLQGTQEALSA